MMDQRISLVTLGVADLARARSFYEALGTAQQQLLGDGRPDDEQPSDNITPDDTKP